MNENLRDPNGGEQSHGVKMEHEWSDDNNDDDDDFTIHQYDLCSMGRQILWGRKSEQPISS